MLQLRGRTTHASNSAFQKRGWFGMHYPPWALPGAASVPKWVAFGTLSSVGLTAGRTPGSFDFPFVFEATGCYDRSRTKIPEIFSRMSVIDKSHDGPEQDQLNEILQKIVVYQHSLPDGRAVEREELERCGILRPADIAFMKSHSVTYEPARRNSFRGASLTLPTLSGCTISMVGGPPLKKRMCPLRGFQQIVADFLKLPRAERELLLHVEFSEFDGIGVSPRLIMFDFRGLRMQARLSAIREVAAERGLTLRHDRKVEGRWSLSFVAPSGADNTASSVAALLRHGCGLDDETEITYSAGALDELDPRFSPDAPVTSGIPEKAYLFIGMCLQAAQKRRGAATRSHLKAVEILAVAAEVARELFGADAAVVLRSAGIDSSASLGKVIYDMIEQRMLSAAEGDKVSDFNVRSSFDDLFE
jgi:uncharacterized repeat protein (TIGR04138 family)